MYRMYGYGSLLHLITSGGTPGTSNNTGSNLYGLCFFFLLSMHQITDRKAIWCIASMGLIHFYY